MDTTNKNIILRGESFQITQVLGDGVVDDKLERFGDEQTGCSPVGPSSTPDSKQQIK